MTGFSAVRAGIRQVMAARRLWLTYYVATLGFGIAAALPLALLLGSSLGGTTWPERMNGRFDLDWLFEFVYRSGDTASTTFGPVVLALGAGYVLLTTFLSGGAIAHFASGTQRYDAAVFWGACGRNFGRLLRLVVYSVIFYAIVLMANSALAALGGRIWAESMEERPVAIYGWARAAVTLLLLLYVNMVVDYARVRLVVDDSRKSLRAALGSFGFVARNFGVAAGAFAIVFALFAALVGTGHVLVRVLPWVLVIIVQQGFVFGRILVKLLFYASETQVYMELRPVPPPAPEPLIESIPENAAADQVDAPPPDAAAPIDIEALVSGNEEQPG
ncbi:MAG TPA: hypothetical protein VN428_11325 [Bryobacteraceae bacterium]|nr:hypothetical protein [Bryobacteraceae bacterium]